MRYVFVPGTFECNSPNFYVQIIASKSFNDSSVVIIESTKNQPALLDCLFCKQHNPAIRYYRLCITSPIQHPNAYRTQFDTKPICLNCVTANQWKAFCDVLSQIADYISSTKIQDLKDLDDEDEKDSEYFQKILVRLNEQFPSSGKCIPSNVKYNFMEMAKVFKSR